MDAETKFEKLSSGFATCHRVALNVFLHLITTPVGLLGLLALLWHLHPAIPAVSTGAYVVSLLFVLPRRLWAVTTLVSVLLLLAASKLQLGMLESLAGIAIGYIGQELAHRLSSEATFQSGYENRPSWLSQFLEHTYFLLPLCLDAAHRARAGAALLGWFAPKSGLLRGHLNSLDDRRDLAAVGDWVEAQNPPTDATAHWWSNALEAPMRETVARVASSTGMLEMFHGRYDPQLFAVAPIHEMNEVYVASKTRRNSSDAVFYTEHIDGPFMIYPFAWVYRCIVAVNENVQIKTSFPMTPTAVTLTTGDVGGFDFNREIHRIEHNPGAENPGRRITLKLHYCIYPKRLAWYGRLLANLTTRYDTAARELFLATLRPKRLVERLLSRAILLFTKAYRVVAEHVGGGTIAYLALLAVADRMVAAPVFLYGSSFIHYLLYMAVYYTREGVAFGTFKRRAMFWKALAAAQLVYIYLSAGRFDPLSLTLVAVGLALSAAAARVLGIERTYFAAELGLCAPVALRRFPYNVIRHPMIVGNIIALAGFYAHPEFRAAAPYLVPLHIAFYVMHLLQEQGVILRNPRHARSPRSHETFVARNLP